MSFTKYWVKAKLPDLGQLKMWQLTLIRRIASNAYAAGRRDEKKKHEDHK